MMYFIIDGDGVMVMTLGVEHVVFQKRLGCRKFRYSRT